MKYIVTSLIAVLAIGSLLVFYHYLRKPSSTFTPENYLRKFLDSGSINQKIPAIFAGREHHQRITDYYSHWPEPNYIDYEYSERNQWDFEIKDEKFHAYSVKYRLSETVVFETPILIRKHNSRAGVDWELFSEFYDRHFEKYIEGNFLPDPPVFRLFAMAVDYDGPDRRFSKEMDHYSCVKLYTPYSTSISDQYAFIEINQETVKSFNDVFPDVNSAAAITINLSIKEFDNGIKHLKIEHLLKGWFH